MGQSASKGPVVLIVEDELLLRMDAVDVIRSAGFEVVEAANADDAIEILEARRDINLVFTDSDAGLDGRPEAGPGSQRALAADQNRSDFGLCGCRGKRSAGGRAVLAKPYRSDQLADIVRELIGASRP